MGKMTLLNNITPESIEEMLPCFQPVVKHYKAGETILSYSSQAFNQIGVLLKGNAKLEFFNADGDDFLLETYEDHDVFGELFSLPLDNFQYLVTATTDCVVIYVSYEHIITPCPHLCPHHNQLISNLFVMTAQKTQELSLHISILNQSSTRGKLLAYLRYIRAKNGVRKNEQGEEIFTLPISLSQLAEYISVDRSAMMRELKAMKTAGIIKGNKREFSIVEELC